MSLIHQWRVERRQARGLARLLRLSQLPLLIHHAALRLLLEAQAFGLISADRIEVLLVALDTGGDLLLLQQPPLFQGRTISLLARR